MTTDPRTLCYCGSWVPPGATECLLGHPVPDLSSEEYTALADALERDAAEMRFVGDLANALVRLLWNTKAARAEAAAAVLRGLVADRARTDDLAAWMTALINDRASWNEYRGVTEDDDLDEARAALAAYRGGNAQ